MLFFVIVLMLRLRLLVRDIEHQRRLAHRQSRTDLVTGLANRLAFETAMDQLSAAATPFAIIVFGLDHFKAVNDALGHAAGDTVLRVVGHRLTGLLGPKDQLARLGGDEFVMISVSRPGAAALATLAKACIAVIEQPIELLGRAMEVGASLGIVSAGSSDLPPSTLLGAADAALYRAKSMPGSSFQFAGQAPSDLANWQVRCA
ncbi:MAG: GGDEF domain-containing protein [Candidatus Devosia euplotis]|nr:GGDEF domain-containing protein [Candidatus Devosia euplotis]